jgi:hypothetical protein
MKSKFYGLFCNAGVIGIIASHLNQHNPVIKVGAGFNNVFQAGELIGTSGSKRL